MRRLATGIIIVIVIALALGIGYDLGRRGASPATAQGTWQRRAFTGTLVTDVDDELDAFLATLNPSCQVDIEFIFDATDVVYEVLYACS